MAKAAQVIQALGGINGNPVVNEALAAASTVIKPGHLIEELAAGTVQEHSVAGANAQRLVALTNTSVGGTIDDAYAVASTVRYGAFAPGQETFLRLPASAPAIVIGDDLEASADGTVRKHVPQVVPDPAATTEPAFNITPNMIVGVAREAVDNSANAVTEVFIKVRIV